MVRDEQKDGCPRNQRRRMVTVCSFPTRTLLTPPLKDVILRDMTHVNTVTPRLFLLASTRLSTHREWDSWEGTWADGRRRIARMTVLLLFAHLAGEEHAGSLGAAGLQQRDDWRPTSTRFAAGASARRRIRTPSTPGSTGGNELSFRTIITAKSNGSRDLRDQGKHRDVVSGQCTF